MTETLKKENNFSITEGLPKNLQGVKWTSKIPKGAVLRIEYENGAFIDIENRVNADTRVEELRVSYSQLVYGEDGGNSTMAEDDMLGEWTNTFKKKIIYGGLHQ